MVMLCGFCDAGTEFVYIYELQENIWSYSCAVLYGCGTWPLRIAVGIRLRVCREYGAEGDTRIRI